MHTPQQTERAPRARLLIGDTVRRLVSRTGLASLGLAAVVAAVPLVSASAATGTMYAAALGSGSNSSVWMGTHLWVSDHFNGFCRLDPAPTAPGGHALNLSTCNTSAKSAGQATFQVLDRVSGAGFVYVPDNSTKSQGVYRLFFNPLSQTVSNPTLLGGGQLGIVNGVAVKPTATAIGSDGNLYVGTIKDGTIWRVNNPAGALSAQTVQAIGASSDGKGVTGIAFANGLPSPLPFIPGDEPQALYLGEGNALSKIGTPVACQTGCVAAKVYAPAAPAPGAPIPFAPMALTSNGADTLYIGSNNAHLGPQSTVYSYSVSANTLSTYATGGVGADGKLTPFNLLSGVTVNPAGGLFVNDDPAKGAIPGQARVWTV
jgi:hypothetical protein